MRLCLKRRERNIDDERASIARGRVQFVNVPQLHQPPAIFAQHLSQRLREIFREEVFDQPADSFVAMHVEHLFERGVAMRHTSVEINSEDADVD